MFTWTEVILFMKCLEVHACHEAYGSQGNISRGPQLSFCFRHGLSLFAVIYDRVVSPWAPGSHTTEAPGLQVHISMPIFTWMRVIHLLFHLLTPWIHFLCYNSFLVFYFQTITNSSKYFERKYIYLCFLYP